MVIYSIESKSMKRIGTVYFLNNKNNIELKIGKNCILKIWETYTEGIKLRSYQAYYNV